MRRFSSLVVAAAALSLASLSYAAPAASPTKWMDLAKAGTPLYATIDTSMGKIVAELDPKIAPIAVENFVGLAMGEKEWKTPAGEMVKKPLYEGTTFHRVIPNFMIQGGDPEGTGMGGPGFNIPDDFPNQHGLTFSKGTLGMARTMAPNSGGCQFFITVGDAKWLDGQYTVFGHVLTGQDVADKISLVPRSTPGDKPNTPVTIKKITITDKAPAGTKKK
ncbi:MAG: peptidylprolyl isomerase [Deltaproteobacteria bacterium]|nr:peptidylprolyl isomerase [Deltaproteobacteria bacterium]